MARTIFLISDRTGITVETLFKGLMSQFGLHSPREYLPVQIPFVDSLERVQGAIEQINAAAETDQHRPIVFSSIVDQGLRELLSTADAALVIDPFTAFLEPLSMVLDRAPRGVMGLSHGVGEVGEYDSRVEAVNFTLATDDGSCPERCDKADLILVGVSRSGKTPTSLYLAIHYGLYVANYPLTQEDLEAEGLPRHLLPYRGQLFGLNISPDRLHRLRTRRRPETDYSSIETCRRETTRAKAIFDAERLPYLDSTTVSIEEISAAILQETGIAPRHF